jgi:uncharacterized protein YeaO (DUF488 family)
MPIKTRRWNDPPDNDEGYRLLVTRYRPRGVAKADETWDAWEPKLGPSKELHREVYTDASSPIPWPQYRRQYLNEQKANRDLIEALAKRVAAGETITLLCSSACTRESRCHRSILKELIEGVVATGATSAQTSRSTNAEHGAQGGH